MTKKAFFLKMITSSLMRRRSRMLVALLAVAIGATILSGLVTIYYDVPRQMGQEFRSYGANVMLVSNGADDLTEEALIKATSFLSKEKLVGLTAIRYETLRLNRLPFMTGGVDFDSIKKTRPYWLVNGDWPKKEDEVLLGETVAQTVAVKAGDKISLVGVDSNGESFTFTSYVCGIVQTGGAEEECIFMQLNALNSLMKNSGVYDVAECSVSASGAELENIVNIMAEEAPEVSPKLLKRLSNSEGAVLTKLQSLVWIVTIVVLVLTMVCVATTMMAVVAERRKEIGLKKALGAGNKNVVDEFLGEGIFLGAVGGILGVVLGFIFAEIVSVNVFARSISFQWGLVPITIIVSVVITALACLIPVKSATTVDPVIVLRGE